MLLRFKEDNATDKDEEETRLMASYTISWYTIIFNTARYIYDIYTCTIAAMFCYV